MDLATELMRSNQQRLADLGYYLGNLDGQKGPLSAAAFTDFKVQHGFRARPFPGPLTLQTLWSSEAQPKAVPASRAGEPPWLAEARRLLGTKEAPGRANSPVIMRWARDLDQWYPGDDVPWCGLFVAHVMRFGAPGVPQNFNRLGARNWLEYGVEADSKSPPLGSVGVLWRTHPTKSWNGHVFIVTGQSADAIRGIGGNQSDNVTEAWFARDRVLGFRVPPSYAGAPATHATTGTLSTNEA